MVCVCACRLVYPACSSQAPYCHVASQLYNIFHDIHKRYDFRKKLIRHKNLFLVSSTTFVCYISHSKGNWDGYDKIFIWVHLSIGYCCAILMILETSWQIFEKFSYIKFRENSSLGWSVVRIDRLTDGRTDRLDEINSRFGKFFKGPKQRNTTWNINMHFISKFKISSIKLHSKAKWLNCVPTQSG
jgi:hypothetical protein